MDSPASDNANPRALEDGVPILAGQGVGYNNVLGRDLVEFLTHNPGRIVLWSHEGNDSS